MAKTRNDETYEKGVNDGKNSNFLDRLVQANIPKTSQRDEIYDKGYQFGLKHRSEDRGNASRDSSRDQRQSSDDSSDDSSSGSVDYTPSEPLDLSGTIKGGLVGLLALGVVGFFLKYVTSRKEFPVSPREVQIRQSYSDSIYLGSGKEKKKVSPHLKYHGQGPIELHYPLSRDSDLEAIVTIPPESVELKFVQHFGPGEYQWSGRIGKKFDRDEDFFLSYDELVTLHDVVGDALKKRMYADRLFVQNPKLPQGGPCAAPELYEDFSEHVVDCERLETFRTNPSKYSQSIVDGLMAE